MDKQKQAQKAPKPAKSGASLAANRGKVKVVMHIGKEK